MSKDRSRELQDLHNKGQADAARGKCEEPHSSSSVVFSSVPYFGHIATALGEKTTEEKNEDNSAYFSGYNNTHEQKKNS